MICPRCQHEQSFEGVCNACDLDCQPKTVVADQDTDDDCLVACYTLNLETDVVASLTVEEMELLPEMIVETLNLSETCVHDGVLYGLSEEQVREGAEPPMWVKDE